MNIKDTILLYPAPCKGHFASMVELGKALVDHHPCRSPPFSVTVIISVPPYEADFAASYLSGVSATHPDISFLHLPAPSDGFPSAFSSPPADFISSTCEFARLNSPSFCNTLSSLSRAGTNVKALILDFFCCVSSPIGASLGIPVYYFYTTGASALAASLYSPTFHSSFPQSLKDLDPGTLLRVPGIPPPRVSDMPLLMLDRTIELYHYFLEISRDLARADGLIINTFDSFEARAIRALREGRCVTNGPTPPTYCVGPIIMAGNGDEFNVRHKCLRWLDSQPSRSVLFLSFGSMGTFSTKQLKEIALSLERSATRFIWVVRAPPSDDEGWCATSEDEPSIERFLPDGFLEHTRGRGFVVESWAPQVVVLNHGSVGGFVTHCGWNSILESVCAGVPMLAWPLYAEQKLNRNYIVEEIGVAVPVNESNDGFVSACELEERITELMGSAKGEAVRERVMSMKEEAAAALSEGGSSGSDLGELIQSFMQSPLRAGGTNPVVRGGIDIAVGCSPVAAVSTKT